ncbi:hypothetical protein BZL29_1588 [Mycobacterium kansasii]|uniref:Uncharacterized protein n=1 Tax=Mycobacterium kansasii TaxID=1768 RepID=A0A1V3XZJ5_MYCKA|nr:hypothetical protein BZL29_1588 [Mycobacterium kansasii]
MNATIRYLMFSVFAVRPGELGEQREAVVDDAAMFFKQQEERGWWCAASTTSPVCGPTLIS